jgi:prepilin signal peptidase PulO-like enzyme (type II secretory pathway)
MRSALGNPCKIRRHNNGSNNSTVVPHIVNSSIAITTLHAMSQFSPDSWTPAVNVLTWFLLVTAILSVITRLGTKYWIFRKFTEDDYLSIVSLVCFTLIQNVSGDDIAGVVANFYQVICAAQSIAVSMATANGYGERFETLSNSNVENMMKVGDILSSQSLFLRNHHLLIT